MAKRKKDLYWGHRRLWAVTFSGTNASSDQTQTFLSTGTDFAAAARDAVRLVKQYGTIKCLVLLDEPRSVRTLIDFNAE